MKRNFEEFKVGYWYVYTGNEREIDWNTKGKMDYVLDHKPVKCKCHSSNDNRFASFLDQPKDEFGDFNREWDWKDGFDNWIELTNDDNDVKHFKYEALVKSITCLSCNSYTSRCTDEHLCIDYSQWKEKSGISIGSGLLNKFDLGIAEIKIEKKHKKQISTIPESKIKIDLKTKKYRQKFTVNDNELNSFKKLKSLSSSDTKVFLNGTSNICKRSY